VSPYTPSIALPLSHSPQSGSPRRQSLICLSHIFCYIGQPIQVAQVLVFLLLGVLLMHLLLDYMNILRPEDHRLPCPNTVSSAPYLGFASLHVNSSLHQRIKVCSATPTQDKGTRRMRRLLSDLEVSTRPVLCDVRARYSSGKLLQYQNTSVIYVRARGEDSLKSFSNGSHVAGRCARALRLMRIA
jgi:hypothetical protein